MITTAPATAAALDQLPPQLLLAILTAPMVIHRGNALLGIHGGRRSCTEHSRGGVPGHALDGADLARLAAVSRDFACPVQEFEGRSVAEEAARHMIAVRCSQGLLRPEHQPILLDAPRRCAINTPAGQVALTWAAALGPWTAPLALRSDPRRVDTSDQGRALLEMVRDDLAPDGCAAAVRRGMTSGTAVSSNTMSTGRHLASFTLLEGTIAVGVCTTAFDPGGIDLYASMTSDGWGWDSDGRCLHSGEITGCFDSSLGTCREGETVGLLLDCEAGCLYAFKEGQYVGVVSHALPTGCNQWNGSSPALSWCVELKGRGCALVRRCPAAAATALGTQLHASARCTDLVAMETLAAEVEVEAAAVAQRHNQVATAVEREVPQQQQQQQQEEEEEEEPVNEC